VVFACHGTIDFPSPLVVSRGSVTLDASGQNVILSGQKKSQLFQVTGGSLTLVDLTLTDGAVTGTNGPKGTAGTAGRAGTNGANGANGSDATSGTENGGNGQPGTDAGDGTDGGDGQLGHPATDGRGGAIYVARAQR
jgi:hypothetical protein